MERVPIAILACLVLTACADPKPDAPAATAPFSLAAAADETFESEPGIRLRYRQVGNGDPVVLLHGFTASLEAVAPLADSLALDHRVIALDQRGHGQSTVPSDTNAFGPEMAEDVVRLLDHLGVSRADLVGHSMGAVVSANVAARHPDRVASVSLIAPPFFADSVTAATELAPVVAELEGGGGFLAFFDRFAPEMPDSIRSVASAEMVSANDRAMLVGVMRTFPELSIGREGVSGVPVPATIVVGSIDTLRVEVRALAASWPGARYLEVEGADHVDVFWHPATLAAVRDQIDSPAERR
ncbi:MAG TPA: alpha/beta fold hydrolase [Gemmatimonadales bacterium]|nr:alpha/beta fold hydrolase [Gemmatimonadales bacterium]